MHIHKFTTSLSKMITFILLAVPNISFALVQINYDYPKIDTYRATLSSSALTLPAGVSWTRVQFSPFNRVIGQNKPMVSFRFFKKSNNCRGRSDELTFVLAGLGGTGDSKSASYLAARLNLKCRNVAVIPSIFRSNVLMAINSKGFLADMSEGSRDFYEMLKSIERYITRNILKTSDNYFQKYDLLGISMGGYTVAKLAEVDEEEQYFNFHKMVMINPPVRLFKGMEALDELKSNYWKMGRWRRRYVKARLGSRIAIHRRYRIDKISHHNFVNSIGFMRNYEVKGFLGNYLNAPLYSMTKASQTLCSHLLKKPINYVFRRAVSFKEYIYNFIPYLYSQTTEVVVSHDELNRNNSLNNIEEKLRRYSNLYVIHNADDFLIDRSDIRFLDEVFASNFYLFPRGGHVGNLWHPKMQSLINNILGSL